MTATKKDLIGRRIVDVEFHRFATKESHPKCLDGTAPILVLDNGRRVSFVAEETEIGEYGVSICITEKEKQ